jgi:hypothetical protein
MLERSILSGMIGKWVYVLIDCELVYESQRVLREIKLSPILLLII